MLTVFVATWRRTVDNHDMQESHWIVTPKIPQKVQDTAPQTDTSQKRDPTKDGGGYQRWTNLV